MFVLKSYLKRPGAKIENLLKLNQKSNDYFISIEDRDSIIKDKDKIDTSYIEGVIYFEYNGVILMDFTYWDIIDQLWAYLINLVEDFFLNKESEVYFPDQPIKLKLKDINESLVLFTIESKDVTRLALPKQELIRCILESGESFFTKLQMYLDCGLDYSFEINKIYKLKSFLE